MNDTSDTAARDEARNQQHLSEEAHEDVWHTSNPLFDEVISFYEWPLAGDESDSIQGVTV